MNFYISSTITRVKQTALILIEKYMYVYFNFMPMNNVDVENLKILEKNGEFILCDFEKSNWLKISPVTAVLILKFKEEQYPLTFLTQLFDTSKENLREILSNFIGELEKFIYAQCRNEKKGVAIEINVADSCSLECKYCYFVHKVENLLSTEEWKKIIDSAAHLNPCQVIFSGGEPLLRRDLFEIAQAAQNLSLKTHLITNGCIPRSSLPHISKNFDSVQVSIDGFSETQRYLREAPFETVVKNMEVLSQSGIELKAGITLTSVNINEVVPLMQYLSERGITRFHISLFKELGRGKEHPYLRPSFDQMVGLFLVIKELNLGVDTLFHMMPRRLEKKENCGAGKEIISIMPDGAVYPCDALISKEFFCGSALHEDLADMYRDSPVLETMRKLTVKDYPVCSSCDVRYMCGGGCVGESFFCQGKLEGPGPDCTFLKKFYGEFIWVV